MRATGKWSKADAIYAGILKVDPTNADARLGEAEIDAWRGHNTGPLQTLDQIVKENPENTEALTLHGDIRRWNWDLAGARQDYQQVLAAETNNYDAKTGLEEANRMGASDVSVTAYQFKDTTDFLREYLEVDGRAHITDRAYLLGDVAGWRFTNPGFSDLDRRDAAAGLEYHFARWLEASAEGTVFDYANTNSRAYFGGQFSTKISPVTGTDIYLSGAYNQPFVSSIATVEGAMRQHSVGAGLDTKLVGRFSFQTEAQARETFGRQPMVWKSNRTFPIACSTNPKRFFGRNMIIFLTPEPTLITGRRRIVTRLVPCWTLPFPFAKISISTPTPNHHMFLTSPNSGSNSKVARLLTCSNRCK